MGLGLPLIKMINFICPIIVPVELVSCFITLCSDLTFTRLAARQ